MAFCENCGAQLAPDSAFCEKCGTRASAPAATVSAASPAKAAVKAAHAAREIACMAPVTPGEAVAGTIDVKLVSQTAVAAVGAVQKASSKKKGSKTPAAPKKKRKLLPVIVGLLMILAGGYAFLAWWPGFHTSTPPVSVDSSSSSSSSMVAASSDGGSVSAPSSSGPASSSGASSGAAPSLSTDARPTFADFDWYMNLVRLDQTPSFGMQIKDFAAISGGWKCLFLYDSMGEGNAASREALNMYISGAKGNFSVVLDLYQIVFGQEVFDESETDDIVLNGSWDDKGGTMEATGTCAIAIKCFYSYEGAQYALGRMENASGEGATVLMMRP